MRELRETAKFRRDCKKIERSGNEKAQRNLALVIKLLLHESALPPEFRDHGLTGNWIGFRDCHIGPDILLIYKATQTAVYLTRLGSHSELF